MTLIANILSLPHLDDLISAGILVAFSMTTCAFDTSQMRVAGGAACCCRTVW
jgi:hypothetical protein